MEESRGRRPRDADRQVWAPSLQRRAGIRPGGDRVARDDAHLYAAADARRARTPRIRIARLCLSLVTRARASPRNEEASTVVASGLRHVGAGAAGSNTANRGRVRAVVRRTASDVLDHLAPKDWISRPCAGRNRAPIGRHGREVGPDLSWVGAGAAATGQLRKTHNHHQGANGRSHRYLLRVGIGRKSEWGC
jgi:hypothetical protein